MPAVNLDDYLDTPERLCLRPPDDLAWLGRPEAEEFQLASARRRLARQAERIPVVEELLGGRDPATFESLADFAGVLLDEDAYKSYDPALLGDDPDYAQLTKWLDRYTSHDLSDVDMTGCDSLTEWCRRLDEHADIFICHSSGTSGVLSFVPRSRRDRDLTVDDLVSRNRSLFEPYQAGDVSYVALAPRRLYRIKQAICDGLESRHHASPSLLFDCFHSPEFHIAQGRLRQAAARGDSESLIGDPLVTAYRGEVEQFQRDLPALTRQWTDDLVNNYRGRRIYFQGTFDRAWKIASQLRQAGVVGAFAPESVLALTGGVKDGTALPPDWLDQVQQATGIPRANVKITWGMSEITGVASCCESGQYHFPLTIIPLLLEPHTRRPLPRTGTQTGQIGVLELNSADCWGGVITGDAGTISFDGACACGRSGPVLDPASIARL